MRGIYKCRAFIYDFTKIDEDKAQKPTQIFRYFLISTLKGILNILEGTSQIESESFWSTFKNIKFCAIVAALKYTETAVMLDQSKYAN